MDMETEPKSYIKKHIIKRLDAPKILNESLISSEELKVQLDMAIFEGDLQKTLLLNSLADQAPQKT